MFISAPPQQEQRRPQYEEHQRQPPAYPPSYNKPAGKFFRLKNLTFNYILAPPQRDPRSAPPTQAAPAAGGGEDQERRQLIQQVLQLTDEQIDMLPEDQKRTIRSLKEQMGNRTN